MSKEVKLKQYPSGFLGSDEVAVTTADNLKDVTSAFNQILNRGTNKSKSNHTSNVEVNSIWEAVLNNTPEINTFEFKSKIIRCAIKSFGTDTIATWLSAQSSNPEFTNDHHKFIDETIAFVAYGTKRTIGVNSWNMILNSKKVDYSTAKYSTYQQKWLLSNNEDNELGINNISKTVKQFIHDWVKQPKGIDDLTAALFIMFGIR